MRRPVFASTVLALAIPAIDAATTSGPAPTLASTSVRKSVQGTGSIVTVDDDVLIRVAGTGVRHLIRIDGSRYPGTHDVEGADIRAEWDATSLTVVADGTTRIALTTDTPGVTGFVVTSYSGLDALGGDPLRSIAEPSSDETITPDANDVITCSDGIVTGDDDCYVGGPGSSQASYKCGWWIFSVDSSVTCSAGYYACISGCGYGDCRKGTCL